MKTRQKGLNTFFTILIFGQSVLGNPGTASKEAPLNKEVKPTAGSIILNILPSVESEGLGQIDKTRIALDRLEKSV